MQFFLDLLISYISIGNIYECNHLYHLLPNFFPTITWYRFASLINFDLFLHFAISNFLENFSTPQQSYNGYDLADYILQQLKR